MSARFIRAATLLACALFSTLALAEPPARVGRVALVEGQVSISADVGDQAQAALVNWPVTSHNQITTRRGARAEFRIGSTAVRLDADSAMEVTELDDDRLRLRLHYGSANVRVRNAEVLPGFELSTPQGRIRLQEPGRLRIDAERDADTSVVNVFDGVALVESGGSQLTVRAGKRAELRDDDVRTSVAVRDSFDDWAQSRDNRDDRATSARYVGDDMTGYEELDQNGVWRDDAEYGPLWQPSYVSPGWAPYRDGSWTWVSPWGWTWIDNAPWGYAPFHYGRWVQVHNRWAWAPGRHIGRAVWAPALVGWVGGGGWSANFGSHGGHRSLPAQGWYPLSPHDQFVPGYRLSHDHLQRINRDALPDRRGGRREHDRREGLTVVPHEQFDRRGTVAVRNSPRVVMPPAVLQNVPAAAPPAPRISQRESEREARGDRFDRDAMMRNRGRRPELSGQPAQAPRPPVTLTAPPVTASQPQPQPQPQPQSQPQPQPQPQPRPAAMDWRREGRAAYEDRGQRAPQAQDQAAPAPAQPPAAAPSPFVRHGGRLGLEDRRPAPQPAPAAPPPASVVPPPAMIAPAPRPRPPVFHQQSTQAAPPAPAPAPPPPPPPPPPPQPHPPIFHQSTQAVPPAPAPAPPPPPPPQPRPPVFHQQSTPAAAPAPAPMVRPAPPPAAPPPHAAPPAAQPAPAAAAAPARNHSGPDRKGAPQVER